MTDDERDKYNTYRREEHQRFHNALLAMGAITSAEASNLLITDHISVMHRLTHSGCEFHASVLYTENPGWTVNDGNDTFHVNGGEFEDALAVFAQLIDDRRK